MSKPKRSFESAEGKPLKKTKYFKEATQRTTDITRKNKAREEDFAGFGGSNEGPVSNGAEIGSKAQKEKYRPTVHKPETKSDSFLSGMSRSNCSSFVWDETLTPLR